MRPRLLDLFCGAGGAAMGYHRAGFDVVGVDIKPQPHYPFEFHKADALTFPLDGFDVVHASPPCQKFTRFQSSQPQRKNNHPDLIEKTRSRLLRNIYVIENVIGAPLLNPVLLCGSAFSLAVAHGYLHRHRLFESRGLFPLKGMACDGRKPTVMVCGHGKDGYRGNGLPADEARKAMQIRWMNRDELAQAIPPAYTEFIGRQLMRAFQGSQQGAA